MGRECAQGENAVREVSETKMRETEKCANEESSLDYLFQLAIEMKKLELPWLSHVEPVITSRGPTEYGA